jgi:carbon-monoxide dehydrogenase large subunit
MSTRSLPQLLPPSVDRKMPGVLGVWTGADLNAAGYGPLKTLIPVPNRDGTPMKTPTRHSLATDKVRFVGDPVAFVVAETLAEAKDHMSVTFADDDAYITGLITTARELCERWSSRSFIRPC